MLNQIEIASTLPLRDAAYLLWISKYQLDRESAPPRQPSKPSADLSDPEIFGRIVRTAFAQVAQERDQAEFGPTFERMKKAHPEAADDDVRRAIKNAVQFDTDCTLNFSYTEAGLAEDAKRAVDQALSKHPGYSDKTRKEAIHHVCFSMR